MPLVPVRPLIEHNGGIIGTDESLRRSGDHGVCEECSLLDPAEFEQEQRIVQVRLRPSPARARTN